MRIGPSFALAFGLVASAVVTAAAAPSRDYIIDVWGTDRGLPTSFVNAVAQTPDGYLWIGTQNGLLRFDGLRFVAFDPDNTPALAHARVEHLFVDGTGTLWANTYDGSLTSVRRGIFQREWTGGGPVDFEAFLAGSSGGEPVFVIDHGPVIRRAAATRRRAAWDVHRPPGDALPLFAEDATGALWVRSVDGGLWRLRDGRFDAGVDGRPARPAGPVSGPRRRRPGVGRHRGRDRGVRRRPLPDDDADQRRGAARRLDAALLA